MTQPTRTYTLLDCPLSSLQFSPGAFLFLFIAVDSIAELSKDRMV